MSKKNKNSNNSANIDKQTDKTKDNIEEIQSENVSEDTEIKEDLKENQEEASVENSDTSEDDNSKTEEKSTVNSEKDKKKNTSKRFNSRAFKRGGLAIALTAVVLVLVVLLNVLVAKISEKFPVLSYDFTAEQAYKLSQDSIDLLSHIDKDIEITVLSKEEDYISYDDYFRQANALLGQYSQYNDKINVNYIDIVSNPSFANKYPDEDLATTDLIVACGDKYKVLTVYDMFNVEYDSYYGYSYIASSIAEEALTSAMLNVISDESVKVAVVTDFATKDYYEYFMDLLKKNNYEVEEMSLLTDEIDAETGIVILLPPSNDYDVTAIEKLSEFMVNSGEYGKTVVYLPSVTTVKTPNIDDFCEEWGLKVGDGLVFEGDTTRLVGRTYMDAVLAQYGDESYTADLKYPNVPVVSLYSRPIEIIDETNTSVLLKYSKSSGIQPSTADDNWSMKDAMLGEETAVAAIGTKTSSSNSSNLVIIGSAESVSESILGSAYNNSDYYLKLLYKLSGREDISVTIESKSLSGSEMTVTVAQANAYAIFFMAVVPLVIAVTGIVIWVRRRNR